MIELTVVAEDWEFKQPVRITGHVFSRARVIRVTLWDGECCGRGEASGVYYRGETPGRMIEQVESIRRDLEAGMDRAGLQNRLRPGGARNAIDCALWDLEAKRRRCSVFDLAGIRHRRPLLTTITLGADTPSAMADRATKLASARAIKLKLTGEEMDEERVRAVRCARPDVWLSVDANQGYSRAMFDNLVPALIECRVELIEQPLPVGREAEMEALDCPIPVAADESAQSCADLPALVGRFRVVTIKLDKSGGLTEALAMVRRARELGFRVMIGCMGGTSLGIAPGYVVGQLCEYVDLDAPLSLCTDRQPAASYEHGYVAVPDHLWGDPQPQLPSP